MADPRDDAKNLLVHYFQLMYRQTGKAWDSDMTVEIEAIVDDIVEASVEAFKDEIRRQENEAGAD